MNQDELGSLSQSARGNQLRSARWILIAIGLLTVALNGFLFFNNESSIAAEVAQGQSQGLAFDRAALNEIIQYNYLVFGSFAIVGIILIALGCLVYKFPIPATVGGLVIYVGSIAITGVLNPLSIVQGIIFKVIVIVAMSKSIQAALAYTRENNA